MNLAYITNSLAHSGGGLLGAVSGLAHGVEAHGVPVPVAGYDGDQRADVWGDLRTYPIHAKRIGGIHFGGDLDHILNEMNPDLVHAHGLWLRSSAQNHKWSHGRGKPYIISPHGMLDPWAVKNSVLKKKLAGRWFEYGHLDDAHCLHALCDSELQSIREFGQRNPVCVLPNGIELPSKTIAEVDAPWECDGRKVLLFLGRLHPKKGLPLLLNAWAELKKKKPEYTRNWLLAIVGWSEVGHDVELKRQARELGIEGDLCFLGSLYGDQKAAALRHASGFVLPSHSEGLPMSVLEAWSYRLPSLITPECNLPVGFEQCAAIQINTNSASISTGMLELFEMSDRDRDEFGGRAYQLVASKFTWRSVAEQMLEVYKWILGGGDAPSCVRFR